MNTAFAGACRSTSARDPVPQPGPTLGRRETALANGALVGIAVAVVAGMLCSLALGTPGVIESGVERRFLAILGRHVADLRWIHAAGAIVAAVCLSGIVFLSGRREVGLGLRGWARVTLLVLLLGALSGAALGGRIHADALLVLLVIAGFQFSVHLQETACGAAPAPRSPGRIRGPKPAWTLDCALAAGAALGAVEGAYLVATQFDVLGPSRCAAAVLMIVSTQILCAGALAAALWGMLAAMCVLRNVVGARWRTANTSLALGGVAALCGTGIAYLCAYHALHDEIVSVRFVPAPSQGCAWLFVTMCVGGAMALRRGGRGFSGAAPDWFRRVLEPLLAAFIPLRRHAGVAGAARRRVTAAALFALPCLCLGLSAFFLYIREAPFLPEKRAVAAQGLVGALVLIVVIAGALGRRRPEPAGVRATARRFVRGACWLAAAVCALACTPVDSGALSVAQTNCRAFWGALKTLRGVCDFDRDGYAALLGGNDPDDFDAVRSPVSREYLEAGAGRAACTSPAADRRAPRPAGEAALVPLFSRGGTADAELRSIALGAPRADAPNLLIVTFDGLRARSLGCHGYGRRTSPHLDAFAQDSVHFEHCLAAGSATHCTLRAFFRGWHCSRRFEKAIDEPTLWTAFREAHVFGRYIGTDYDHIVSPPGQYAPGRISLPWGRAREVFPLFLRALEQLRERETWCAWVHVNDTHFEFARQADGTDFGSARVDLYDNNLSSADRAFGALLEALARRGLYDRTVVVVSADHGAEFGEHGGLYHGPRVYEEVLHVPLMIRVPGTSPRHVAAPVSHLDVAPTLAELFGLPDPPCPYDGVSLAPVLAGAPPRTDRCLRALSGFGDLWVVLAPDRWKLIHDRADNTWELYDLVRDPGEMRNLYGRGAPWEPLLEQEVFAFMLRGYARYNDPHPHRARIGAPLD